MVSSMAGIYGDCEGTNCTVATCRQRKHRHQLDSTCPELREGVPRDHKSSADFKLEVHRLNRKTAVKKVLMLAAQESSV